MVSYFNCAQHPISIIPVSFLLATRVLYYRTDIAEKAGITDRLKYTQNKSMTYTFMLSN